MEEGNWSSNTWADAECHVKMDVVMYKKRERERVTQIHRERAGGLTNTFRAFWAMGGGNSTEISGVRVFKVCKQLPSCTQNRYYVYMHFSKCTHTHVQVYMCVYIHM